MIKVQLNEATFFDSIILKALQPSQQFKFLSYISENSVFRNKLAREENETIFITQVVLDNVKMVHARYNLSLWEICGLVGGFATFAIFAFQFLYKIFKANSVYVLTH